MISPAELARRLALAGGLPPLGKVIHEGDADLGNGWVRFVDKHGNTITQMPESEYELLLGEIRRVGSGD